MWGYHMIVIMVMDMSATKNNTIIYIYYYVSGHVAIHVIQSYTVTKGYSKLWATFAKLSFFFNQTEVYIFIGNIFQTIKINIKVHQL